MNAYTAISIGIVCITVIVCALIWAAVRINQTKGK